LLGLGAGTVTLTQTVNSAPVARVSKRSVFSGLGTFVAIVIAVTLIVISNPRLRRDENLVAALRAQDTPVFLPLADYFRDQINTKTNWNDLNASLNLATAKSDQKLFTSASMDLAKFIELHISQTDERRVRVLTNLVGRYPTSVDSIPAYMELLSPELKPKMEPAYPLYAHRILQMTSAPGRNMADVEATLAAQLQADNEPALEMEALRQLFQTQPPGPAMIGPLTRLLALLGPTDPDRPKLQRELDEYNHWTAQVTENFDWYQKFQSACAKGSVSVIEQARASAPPDLLPSFVAAADASLALIYVRAGRYEEADRLRQSLVHLDLSGVDDVDLMLSTIQEQAVPVEPTKKHRPPMVTIDENLIKLQRWRGLLLSSQFTEAIDYGKSIFPPNNRVARRAIEDEEALAQGKFPRSPPHYALRPRINHFPPELYGEDGIFGGTFKLLPTGKAIPADIRSQVQMWVSSELIVIDCTADEPRSPLPPVQVKTANGAVWHDESFEFSFDPDRWLDSYYQVDVNSAGVSWAGRVDMINNKSQMHLMPALDVKSTASKTATGWALHVVMQRKLLIRPGPSVLRFNLRRMRYLREAGQSIRQLYSWSPADTGDHQPERWGWLIVPAPLGEE
jgi:hypothetical protein